MPQSTDKSASTTPNSAANAAPAPVHTLAPNASPRGTTGLNAGEAWLSHILDTIDEGIHAVDVRGTTIVYNAAAGRMDGLVPEDVVGRHVIDVFPSLAQNTSTLLQVLQTGDAIYNRAQTYTNVFGVKVHTVNTTLPIKTGETVVGAVEIAKDMTQVKHLAEQVVELQAKISGKAPDSRQKTPRVSANDNLRAVYQFSHILTKNAKVEGIKDSAARAARTSSPVLIYGETGTGKELLVQSIHSASPRNQAPFLAINCAALPAPLLEGILFGTVRGSFTGAEDRQGMFELATGGTMFLDEIQSMPLELQAKLLRVLQEGELMRVGDTRIRRVDVRLVAAMNERPETALKEGKIRDDLYYRIHVVRLDLPPLRERPEDISLLTEHFIEKWNRRFDLDIVSVSPQVLRLFTEYRWPGNVRELENTIEGAMNMVTSGLIEMTHLPLHLREWATRNLDLQASMEQSRSAENSAQTNGDSSSGNNNDAIVTRLPEWGIALQRAGMNEFWDGLTNSPSDAAPASQWAEVQLAFERLILMRALKACEGNVKRTAERLGMPRQTLQYRLKQIGL